MTRVRTDRKRGHSCGGHEPQGCRPLEVCGLASEGAMEGKKRGMRIANSEATSGTLRG
jgi:hypothetical protein